MRRVLKFKNIVLFLSFIFLILGIIVIRIDNSKQGIGTSSYIENNKNYYINAMYPVTSSESFNKKIKTIINDKVKQFKEHSMIEHQIPFEYNINYKVYHNSNILSIVFNTYLINDQAHSSEESFILYYDKKNKKEIAYQKLFSDQYESLEIISNIVKKQLNNSNIVVYDGPDFNKGIAPVPDNYQLLVFDKNELKIIFPRYQIAPRSTGEITININYSQLNGVLNNKLFDVNYHGGKRINVSNKKTRNTRDITSLKNKKYMLITFDDGPSGAITNKLLDELKKRNIRVTFFVLGSQVEKYPNIVKRAYLDGHTIASHTYDHKNLVILDDKKIKWEIKVTDDLIKKITNKDNNYLRPPYGSSNDHVFSLIKKNFIYWDIDTEDWKIKDAQRIKKMIINNAHNGAISLSHDLYSTSIIGNMAAIDELLKKNYQLISLEEAEALGYLDTNKNESYYFLK
ncbi:MAG: polysaccharide deacetylase family protein [Bacilli bacterium]|jgi:peptidoglycan/xylan/chitin deacetylase (PgdA/CDA1 family)|nr:polysaccharide deacetylase family protein [Bacilli bacterium]